MELTIPLDEPQKAAALFGPGDKHLRTLRDAFGVQIFARGNQIKLTGSPKPVSRVAEVLNQLQRDLRRGKSITAATKSGYA